MSSVIFNDLLLQGIRSGQLPARTEESRKWFRDKAESVRKVNEAKFIREMSRDRFQGQFRVGHMFMYYYDPKHKEDLPYYDKFPLVFPIGRAKGGFLALNLHYLPLDLRAKLMDALYSTVNNQKFDETTKLKISYSILKDAAKFDAFRPTIKHYLTDHVRSRFIWIHPTEWDLALHLPLERFEKAAKTTVWADSRRAILGKSKQWRRRSRWKR